MASKQVQPKQQGSDDGNKQGNQAKSGDQQKQGDQGKQGEQLGSRRGQSTAGKNNDSQGRQNPGRPGKGGS